MNLFQTEVTDQALSSNLIDVPCFALHDPEYTNDLRS